MPTLEAMTFIDLIMHLRQAFVFYKNAWQKRSPGEGHMQNITLMNNAFVLSRQRGSTSSLMIREDMPEIVSKRTGDPCRS